MFRLLGILLGSAIAVAFLILLVGIPQLSTDKDAEPVAVQLPMRPEPLVAPPATTTARDEAQTNAPTDPAVTATALAEQPADIAPADVVATPPEPAVEPLLPTPPPVAADMRWYAFWSPFRSQIAANGFIAQLQRVTGLDYRVVTTKPGVYEVAFAYGDDAEIQANLEQISAATGLDIPEG